MNSGINKLHEAVKIRKTVEFIAEMALSIWFFDFIFLRS